MIQPPKSPTARLCRSALFEFTREHVGIKERIDIAHARAKEIAAIYAYITALDADDILQLSPKFWSMYTDLIVTLDGAAVTLFSIQLNLAGGTLASYVYNRPDLHALLKRILNFEVSAQFMLTELAHGLDAMNIETTAVLMPDGTFDLHTPRDEAAKYMPPTLPYGNVPRIAIVMARLVVSGEDRGIRPFVVLLGDGKEMCAGVTARVLPTRCGAKPVGHALTYFQHVKLPASALLGSLRRPSDLRLQFLSTISRVTVGTLSLSALVIPGLKVSAFITARYSLRRTVSSPNGTRVPILSFRTQHAPILHALAEAAVLEAFYAAATDLFVGTPAQNISIRNAIATVFKTTTMQQWRLSSVALSDRCGAQGLFDYNQISAMEMEMRGVAIAEGDYLVLSIRLVTELILGRYALPQPTYPEALLSRREFGIVQDYKSILKAMEYHTRSEDFNRRIVPHCTGIVEAIGHRMAYEAGLAAGVEKDLLNLYEAGRMKQDSGWYVENLGISCQQQRSMEELAITKTLPRLQHLLTSTGAEPYAFAAIVSEEAWKDFVLKLDRVGGNAGLDLFGQGLSARL